MTTLFGTDGVRGVANRDLTPDLALALGRAAGLVVGGGRVVVGRDTRVSGPMLEAALIAGLCSAGVDVAPAGILPTPGISFLVTAEKCAAGAVISASHNPVPDNGIKLFSDAGVKLPADVEAEIERILASPQTELPTGTGVGEVDPIPDASQRYVEHLVGALADDLRGLKIVLDCGYGAAYSVAPQAFRAAGAEVVAINDRPDGSRINVDCGSTSLEGLAKAVVTEGADLGCAFDGDADRVLAVDERGDEVDGDRILAVLAGDLKARGELDNDVVVATVMSNLGFRRALEDRGIEVITTPVGDRHVAEAMAEHNAVIGGEKSGHLILSRFAPTGDGVLVGLQTAAVVARTGRPLSALAGIYDEYPQTLINVPVARKAELRGAADLWARVEELERTLGGSGRILVRPSGTEPLVRVMVEAADRELAGRVAAELAEAVRERLG